MIACYLEHRRRYETDNHKINDVLVKVVFDDYFQDRAVLKLVVNQPTHYKFAVVILNLIILSN